MKNLWVMMSTGAVGPYRDYLLTYPLYQQDPKKRKTFEQVFPDINDMMRLKDSRNPTEQEQARMAAATMLAMPGFESAPKWLKQAMSGGADAST